MMVYFSENELLFLDELIKIFIFLFFKNVYCDLVT